ncbi:hypothetical protein M569_00949, partial [Genlisea aurea]
SMEAVLSSTDQQRMVTSFLEIAVGQTAETARQFLQATSWKLEEAIQLFYIENEGGSAAASSFSFPPENDPPFKDLSRSELDKDFGSHDGGEDVRPPLPAKRDVLYDGLLPHNGERMGTPYGAPSVVPFRNFQEEMRHPGVWEPERGSSSSMPTKPQDNLASLYRPPFALMFHGSFEKAKDYAKNENKWLLINMQSTREFSSHMLNRDTWANEAVAQTIKANFIFWQVYDDTEEGSKVCTYYKLDSIPAVLLLDPLTGQKLRTWRGMVEPESLLEDLLPFMDGSPSDNHSIASNKRPRESSDVQFLRPHRASDKTTDEDDELRRALAASLENFESPHDPKPDENIVEKKPDKSAAVAYLPLPEESKGDKNLLCRIGLRLPNGRRVQRNFLRSDPVQLLWSFCLQQITEIDNNNRPFRLTQAIPGASRTLDYDVESTFEESGLDNTMVSVTWE